jgi:nucleoside-diphosphate-sugar epimerase
MKILIIGGAGYIGSVLTAEFLKVGHEVVVLDLLKRGSDGIIMHRDNPMFTLVNTDFTNQILPLCLIDVGVVVHLAAVVGDPACEKEPELATKINVEGVKHVVDCCNKHDLQLYFASTASVYGSHTKTCDESTGVNPLSHYACTKVEAEEYIRNNSNNGIIFRFGTMYGVSPNMRYDLSVNRITYDAVKFSSYSIFDGTQFRPFLHPKDVANFFLSIMEMDLKGYKGEVFNLVSENLSMLELGKLVERTIPTAVMNLVPKREDNRSYICRSIKAHTELGFSPKIRVRDGIQEIEREILKIKKEVKIRVF